MCFYAGEAAVAVVFVVRRPGYGRANTAVDICVVGKEPGQNCQPSLSAAGGNVRKNLPFLRGPVEVGSMIDLCTLARRATEDFGLPRVNVRIKMDDRDGPVSLVDTP